MGFLQKAKKEVARTFNLREQKKWRSPDKNLSGIDLVDLMAEKTRQVLATMLLDVPKTERGGGIYIYLLSLLQVPPPPLNITSVVYTLDPPPPYSGLMPIKINPGRDVAEHV